MKMKMQMRCHKEEVQHTTSLKCPLLYLVQVLGVD